MLDGLAESDRQFIALAAPEKLAEWWCQINRYKWPTDGLHPPPPGWPCQHNRASQILDAIEHRIGMKKVYREWNRDMSPDEFESWWNSDKSCPLCAVRGA